MTAQIARRGSRARAEEETSGRQPADNATQSSGDVVNGLVFNVVTGEVATPKRGGRAATVEIPVTVANAFDHMLKTNPDSDQAKMAHVPVTLTNQQIQQWLVQGISKLKKRVPADRREYVKSTITVVEGSPNKRSVAKADQDKHVSIEWTVRYMSDDEYKEKVRASEERRANVNA